MRDSGAQRQVIRFLSDPASHSAGVGRVDRIDTHVSHVFLAGDRVCKLKRAVKFPYLDFSTPAKRHAACAAELALNRRTAPDLYLGLRGIARSADGGLRWADTADAVDWVVVMRRFDQAMLFDSLAQRGELTEPMLTALADAVAGFHERAAPRPDAGGGKAVAGIVARNLASLRRAGPDFFAAREVAALAKIWRVALAAVTGLLDARRDAGKVRHCHGDLHLRNIALIKGRPVLFDCLEFSEEMASIDVLYDLAFLLMDLEHRGLRPAGSLVANRYLDLTGDENGLPALPLFLSVRAAIRAQVTATAAALAGGEAKERQAADARAYLRLARDLMEEKAPRLMALGGVSGTGKSTVARRLAPRLGRAPGARVLRSDVIRKRLCGVAPEVRLPPEAYSGEMSRRVYGALCETAAAVLRSGYCAVIDAVSLTPDERASFAATADAAGVPFDGVWLEAAPEVLAARVASRRGDASDATEAVLRGQLGHDPGPIDWRRVDVGGDPEASFAAVAAALDLTPRDQRGQ